MNDGKINWKELKEISGTVKGSLWRGYQGLWPDCRNMLVFNSFNMGLI